MVRGFSWRYVVGDNGDESRMMGRVFQQEWRVLKGDRTMWLALSVFALLIGYGVWNGARWVRFQQRAVPLLQAQQAEKRKSNLEFMTLVAKDPKGQFIPWHSGVLGYQLWPPNVLPPAPLAATAIGQSDLHPAIVEARAKFDWALAREEIENPTNLLTGRFDLAFVLVYLLPLLILGLSYNILSGEREGGTLALALAQPVGLKVLCATKILARALPLFVVTIGATLFFLVLNGVNPFVPNANTRAVLWLFVVLLYGAFWFALTAWVNARGWSSATNAVALAGAWLGLVLILPSLVSAAATTLHTAPPRLELTQAIHRADDQAKETGRALLEAHYLTHPDQKPVRRADLKDYWTQRYAMDAHMERELAPLLGRVEQSSARRRNLSNALSFLSPALLTQSALGDIAGTGDARYEEFTRQVDEFRQEWRDFFVPRVFRQVGLPAEQWDTVPQWSFHEETGGDVARRVLPMCLMLAFASLILGAWSSALLRRYPVAA